MGITKIKAVFSLGSTVKHSRSGKKTPPTEFHARPEEPSVCPVATLHDYLGLSKNWSHDIDSQPFLSLSTLRAASKSKTNMWGLSTEEITATGKLVTNVI